MGRDNDIEKKGRRGLKGGNPSLQRREEGESSKSVSVKRKGSTPSGKELGGGEENMDRDQKEDQPRWKGRVGVAGGTGG